METRTVFNILGIAAGIMFLIIIGAAATAAAVAAAIAAIIAFMRRKSKDK